MLRFLTDDDFDGRVTSGLLARLPNLDLVRVQDVGLMSTPDDAILGWAGKQDRIVLTHDRNTLTTFAGDRIQAGEPMPGLIVLKLMDHTIGQLRSCVKQTPNGIIISCKAYALNVIIQRSCSPIQTCQQCNGNPDAPRHSCSDLHPFDEVR